MLVKRKKKDSVTQLEVYKDVFTIGIVFNNSKAIGNDIGDFTINKESKITKYPSGEIVVELGKYQGSYTLYRNGIYAEIIKI